jgi:hypothetical protein
MSYPKLADAYSGCGYPQGTNPDVLAWNALLGGTSKDSKTELKVGIFGYDMTCVEEWCARLLKDDF